jgi:hypothetical protein
MEKNLLSKSEQPHYAKEFKPLDSNPGNYNFRLKGIGSDQPMKIFDNFLAERGTDYDTLKKHHKENEFLPRRPSFEKSVTFSKKLDRPIHLTKQVRSINPNPLFIEDNPQGDSTKKLYSLSKAVPASQNQPRPKKPNSQRFSDQFTKNTKNKALANAKLTKLSSYGVLNSKNAEFYESEYQKYLETCRPTPEGLKKIWKLAEEILCNDDINLAYSLMMDFGDDL